MKHFTFNFKWLVMSLLLCIGSSAWGKNNVSTVSTKFSATGNVTSNFTQTGDLTSAAWNLAVTWKNSAAWQNLDTTKGSQIGTASNPATSIVLTGSNIPGIISSVVVNTSGANSVNATISVTVGGTAFKCNNNNTASITSSAANYTFTGTGSGNVVITWTQSSSKAIYVKSVTTTYTPTHTLTYSAENGSIAGVIYNTSTGVASEASVAEGGKVTLTATPASGYTFTGWSVEGTGSTLTSTSTNPTTFTMGTANSTVTAVFEASTTVANPTFTVSEGTYNEEKSVEINCSTDGATIYYTTDGTDPNTSSSVYSSAISVTQTTTIKAFAVKAGLDNSGIASATYTLKCATPTITVPAGAFLDSKVVTMTATDGATIYYTTNSSVPTNSSTPYDSANKPSISATTTFKAIAIKAGWSDSEVATATFTKIVPKTVGEALTAITALANNGTIDDQYVRGIVCTTGSLSSGAITYYISADGTETNRLQVYKGKGLNNADFAAASDIAVGDEVIVFGQLKKYVNGNTTTPEFNSGNYLISKVTKETPDFTLNPTSKTLDAYSHETVDITLTTNTDGLISCESDNEDVATVALKSGNVYTITAKTEGTATITIRSAASATYKPASAIVEITVTDNRTDAGISFTDDEKEITWGDSFTGQALTNDNSVAVEWSSTNEDVATVDNTGAVTVLKAGTTEIKANFAGNATYKAAVASYTLTVNKAAAGLSFDETEFDIELNDDSFVAPTLNNPHSLAVTYASSNEEVALVDENTGELTYYETATGTATITATFAGNDWYNAGYASYTITIYDPTVKGSKYNPYTIAEVANLTENLSNVYITGYIVGCVNSNKCYKTTTSSLVNTNILLSDDPNKSITEGEQISGTSGMAPVELPTSPAVLRSNWGFKDNNVLGYKVICKGTEQAYYGKRGMKSTSEISAVSVPATLNASGYATFASTYALDFTDDSQFSAWKVTGVTSTNITFTQIDGTVATGTGVILKGTASATVNIPVTATGTNISTTNKLVGITTATAVTADTYYGLSGDTFKKVAAGTVPAGKALLPASEIGAGVKVLNLVFDDATGISTLERVVIDNDAWYDLQGRRIAQPNKGIYIHNGKKVFIK